MVYKVKVYLHSYINYFYNNLLTKLNILDQVDQIPIAHVFIILSKNYYLTLHIFCYLLRKVIIGMISNQPHDKIVV